MGVRIAAYNDDIAADVEIAADIAAREGLDGLAIRNPWGTNLGALGPTDMRRIREIADSRGLAITALGAPYGRQFFIEDDDAQRAAEALLGKMFDFAEILGTRYVRIFALWLRDHDSYESWADRPDYSRWLDQLIARLEPSVRMAERSGYTLMIETEGASWVGQVREARQVFELLNSPAVTLCWDVANAWRSGELPPDGLALARTMKLADVNLKDLYPADGAPDVPSTRRAVVGEGGIPYREIIETVLDDGFDGAFTVERNYYPRRPEDHPELQADIRSDIRNGISMIRAAQHRERQA
jgi:sugar phosphate isomerase/epimerase